MKKYDIIAFDLDGTLSDPEPGIVGACEYSLGKMGIEYGTRESLRRFIGPPLYETWQREFGISAEECSQALVYFREYYDVTGWCRNTMYAGIPEMLRELKSRGKRLAVATSKPEDTAHRILELFDIAKYFDFIGGAASDKTRDKKSEVLSYVLDALGCTDKASAILVGDRMYDAEGAALVGIDSLGVMWGHGPREEIEGAGFTLTAEGVEDVLKLLQ